MKRLLSMTALFALFALAGCGTNHDGERCNPLRATSDCDPGLSCVYPTAPSCGVSYCCALGPNGNIVDTNPNCQPDPSSAAACMLDMSELQSAASPRQQSCNLQREALPTA